MEERFLDLYKAMEGLLKEKYGEAGRSGVVMKFLSSPGGRPFRERLNTCREMRNILSHSPDIRGEAPLYPSAGAVAFMEEVVAYLQAPPRLLEVATPADRLMTAKLSTALPSLLRRMEKEGFSHVPVLEEGRFRGIFSPGVLFSLMLETGDCGNIRCLRDLERYLPIHRHVCETFAFVDRRMTVDEGRALLNRAGGPRHRRMAALLITENGRPQEALLGMATPWDVILDEEKRTGGEDERNNHGL